MTVNSAPKATPTTRGGTRRSRSADRPAEAKTGSKLRPAGSSKPQRRPMALLLAVVLAIAGAAGVYIGVGQSGDVNAVVMKNDVTRGQEITKADLTTISVGKDTKGIITADEVSSAEGKLARVDLPAGSLLTTSTIAETVEIPSGTAVVGIAVAPAGLPSRQLRAGDQVRIVYAPADQETQGENQPDSIPATVEQTRTNRDVGLTIVDVAVPNGQAETATRWSAAGAASIVIDSDDTTAEQDEDADEEDKG